MLGREERAGIAAFIIVVGFWIGVAYYYRNGYYFNLPYPRNTFLAMPSDVGNDFFHLFDAVKAGSPYSWIWSLYFPFSYIPIYPLTVFSRQTAYAIFCLVFLGFASHLAYRYLAFLPKYQRWLAAFIIVFASYPVVFILERGNFEMMIFVYIYLFLHFYQRGKLGWSAFFLACAAAMKLYPAVLGVLFLRRSVFRRQFKYGLLSAVFAVLLTCGSAALYPGGIGGTYRTISGKMDAFKDNYVVGDEGLPYTCSYFGLVKTVMLMRHPKYHAKPLGSLPPAKEELARILPYYNVIALCIFAVIAVCIIWRERLFWQQVAVLICTMLLLPTVTVDYKLILLLFPLMLFIATEERTRFDWLYLILLVSLLIPKSYIWIRYNVATTIIWNPLLMTALVVTILLERQRAATPAPVPVPSLPVR